MNCCSHILHGETESLGAEVRGGEMDVTETPQQPPEVDMNPTW
jgi:hypothetical protein